METMANIVCKKSSFIQIEMKKKCYRWLGPFKIKILWESYNIGKNLPLILTFTQ